MDIDIKVSDLVIILEALESYQLDIEDGTENGYDYHITVEDVDRLMKYIDNILDKEIS